MNIINWLGTRAVAIALATGAAFTTMCIVSLLADNPEHYIDALMMIPFTLMFFGVVGVHQIQKSRGIRSEVVGYRILAISVAAMVITQPLIIFDVSSLSWISFPCLFLGLIAGTAVFGYGTYRAHVLPSWCAIALGLSQLITMAAGIALSPISGLHDYGDYSGAIGHGLVWFGIAYAVSQLAPTRSASIETSVATAAGV